MKGNSLLVGLSLVLAVLSLAVAALAFQYVQLSRALNTSQFTLAQVEMRQNRLKALVAEAVDYSQRNPAIDPLLLAIGAKGPAPAPASPRTPGATAPQGR